MTKDKVFISQTDKLGRTYKVQSGACGLGKIVFAALDGRKIATVQTAERSIELTGGGEELQFCCASESGERRALMLINLSVRKGKIFGIDGATYLVDMGNSPESEIVFTRQGAPVGVAVTRQGIDSDEQIQSEVVQGKFNAEELLMLAYLAAFYLLSGGAQH